MKDVVPVAVPYTVSAGTTTRIPAEHHLLHWCTVYSLPPEEDELRSEQHPLHPGLTALNGTLHVDGHAVGATSDILRRDTTPALAFWNITEPLSEGTHTAEFRLTVPTDRSGPSPERIGVADELSIDWEPGKTVSLERTLVTVSPDDVPKRSDVDPLWGRREVYYTKGGGGDGEDDIETFPVSGK